MKMTNNVLFADCMYYGSYYEWVEEKYLYGSEKRTGNQKQIQGELFVEIECFQNQRRKSKKNYLICGCGYQGIPLKKGIVYENITESYQTREIVPKQAHRVEKSLFQCPKCSSVPKIVFPSTLKRKEGVLNEVSTVKETSETLLIEWESWWYEYKNGVKIEKRIFQLIYHYKRKRIYFYQTINGKEKKEIYSIQSIPALKKEWSIWKYAKEKEKKQLKIFIEKCIRKSDIMYRKKEEITTKNETSFIYFEKIASYLEMEQLEVLPNFNWIQIPNTIKETIRKLPKKEKTIWNVLIGHSSKTIRQKINHEKILKELMVWGHLIHEPDNLTFIIRSIPTGQSYTETDVFETIRNEKEYERQVLAIQWFIRLHQNETHFIHVIQKTNPIYIGKQKYDIDYQKMMEYIIDSHEMYREIKTKNKKYELKYKNHLEKLHQSLTRDYNRMKKSKKMFHYTKMEQKLEKKTELHYFKLPKTNHDLIKVGNDMEICVSHYEEKVKKKETTILFAYDQNEKIKLCLEVKEKKNKEKVLMQVKQAYNHVPTEKQKKDVIQWCKEKEIIWKECDDLKKENEYMYQ